MTNQGANVPSTVQEHVGLLSSISISCLETQLCQIEITLQIVQGSTTAHQVSLHTKLYDSQLTEALHNGLKVANAELLQLDTAETAKSPNVCILRYSHSLIDGVMELPSLPDSWGCLPSLKVRCTVPERWYCMSNVELTGKSTLNGMSTWVMESQQPTQIQRVLLTCGEIRICSVHSGTQQDVMVFMPNSIRDSSVAMPARLWSERIEWAQQELRCPGISTIKVLYHPDPYCERVAHGNFIKVSCPLNGKVPDGQAIPSAIENAYSQHHLIAVASAQAVLNQCYPRLEATTAALVAEFMGMVRCAHPDLFGRNYTHGLFHRMRADMAAGTLDKNQQQLLVLMWLHFHVGEDNVHDMVRHALPMCDGSMQSLMEHTLSQSRVDPSLTCRWKLGPKTTVEVPSMSYDSKRRSLVLNIHTNASTEILSQQVSIAVEVHDGKHRSEVQVQLTKTTEEYLIPYESNLLSPVAGHKRRRFNTTSQIPARWVVADPKLYWCRDVLVPQPFLLLMQRWEDCTELVHQIQCLDTMLHCVNTAYELNPEEMIQLIMLLDTIVTNEESVYHTARGHAAKVMASVIAHRSSSDELRGQAYKLLLRHAEDLYQRIWCAEQGTKKPVVAGYYVLKDIVSALCDSKYSEVDLWHYIVNTLYEFNPSHRRFESGHYVSHLVSCLGRVPFPANKSAGPWEEVLMRYMQTSSVLFHDYTVVTTSCLHTLTRHYQHCKQFSATWLDQTFTSTPGMICPWLHSSMVRIILECLLSIYQYYNGSKKRNKTKDCFDIINRWCTQPRLHQTQRLQVLTHCKRLGIKQKVLLDTLGCNT